MADVWYLDPEETLNFIFDWAPLANGNGESNWLDQTTSPVETISSQTTTPADSPGITVVSSAITDNSTSVTVKLSAANATAGHKYRLTNQITTSTGQVAERTVVIHVLHK